MREKEIEAKLVQATAKCDGWAVKLTSPPAAGLPDRLLLLPHGVAVFVEVKAPGQKPRPLQSAIHHRLRNLGFPVFVLDDPAQISCILEEVKRYGIHSS